MMRKNEKFMRNFVQTYIGAPGNNSFRKKIGKENVFFRRKSLTITEVFEDMWLVGTNFRR